MTQARELQRDSPPAAADPTSLAPGHRAPEGDPHHTESTAPQVTRSSIRRLRTLSRVYLVLVVLLLIAVVVLVVLFNQVRTAAIHWEEEAHLNHEAAQVLGKEVAELRDELSVTTNELDTVTAQLQNVQNRLTELGAQVANTDDDVAYLNQLLAQLNLFAQKSVDTTDAYGRCLEGLDLLIVYLRNPELYDPAGVEEWAEQVENICTYAGESHQDLREMLEGLQS